MERDVKNADNTLARATKLLLDFMFYAGIVITVTLPWTVKWLGAQKFIQELLPNFADSYREVTVVYFVLGVAALVLVNELRRIFRTVLAGDCFVEANVESLKRMGSISFFIALMSAVRIVVYLSIAMIVVVFVFLIAGMFSKVLAQVFKQAVEYKLENDLTI